jgi:hypothetical protein
MKYPCVPVWMKYRSKDPFDYPLRSKKEVMFEQYLAPPIFNVTAYKSDYAAISSFKHLKTNKADQRNDVARFEVDIREIMLSPLQKKRMIFLLGPRYNQRTSKFKIVCRRYATYEHNFAKAVDIFRQLYWEAKRAPIFHLPTMRPSERKMFKRKILGTKLTKEQTEAKITELNQFYAKSYETFNALYETGNYTLDVVKQRIEERLFKGGQEKEEQILKERLEKEKAAEELLAKENVEKELVKKNVLTQKAYDLFFKSDKYDKNDKKD